MTLRLWTPQDRIDNICRQVAAKYHIRPNQLVGLRRDKSIVIARHEAMARVRAECQLSLPQIGRYFQRHHTTVLDAIRRHAERTAESMQGAP